VVRPLPHRPIKLAGSKLGTVANTRSWSPAHLFWSFSFSWWLPQICPEVSASSSIDDSKSQSHSILTAPPSIQILLVAAEISFAESEGRLQSFRGASEHLKVLRSTDESYRCVWGIWVWLPDRFVFCWCRRLWQSQFGHALGGQDWANWKMPLEVINEPAGRYTSRPRLIKLVRSTWWWSMYW